MAEIAEEPLDKAPALTALQDSPFFRHLAVMIGIAASVALGVAVVLWSQTPSYTPLYGNLAEKDVMEVVDALRQTGVDFKLDQKTGMVMVPTEKEQEVRMQLASQGLPRSEGLGFEMLNEDTGFGTSRMVEKARYHHALEGELARTISTLASVRSARVHLALPKQSVFVRRRKQPSASVVLKLYAGRKLEQGQVDAIVHLVASSVPELTAERVTVVDQKGRMLSDNRGSQGVKLSSSQFDYARKIEEHYRQRIEDLLSPILGPDRVRAQVTADIDFTVIEQTQERYNPDQPALRSEQLNEQSSSLSAVQGVPGALSNQPPQGGTAPEQAAGQAGTANSQRPLNSTRNSTRNYELDRVISHTRMSPNTLRRLSVAVVVDDIRTVGADGQATQRERSPEELQRLTQLVREAVGFNAQRGDTVQVVNSPFMAPEPVEPLPEPAIWEQNWFWDVIKQVGGVLLVLLLIFAVLRPTLRKLTSPAAETGLVAAGAGAGGEAVAVPAGEAGAVAGAGAAGAAGVQGVPGLPGADEALELPGPGKYENVMEAARNLVNEDPKRVAQLVKTWIAENE